MSTKNMNTLIVYNDKSQYLLTIDLVIGNPHFELGGDFVMPLSNMVNTLILLYICLVNPQPVRPSLQEI